MTPAERLARLRLIRTPNVGPVSWRQLLQRFGSGEAALAALPDLAVRGGTGKVRLAPADVAQREIDRVAALGARHIFIDDPDYSPMLREVEGAPPVMTVRGDAAMLQRPCVAIVGARNASAVACRFARQLAADLVARDVTVVSGLARGVDTAAHIGALGGSTAAVIGSGIDIAFPPENAGLQEKIAADQLLIAEQPSSARWKLPRASTGRPSQRSCAPSMAPRARTRCSVPPLPRSRTGRRTSSSSPGSGPPWL